MEKENKLPNLMKAIIIILSLAGGMLSFFTNPVMREAFLSSKNMSWEGNVSMITTTLMPFLFGAFLFVIVIIISALFKKKIEDKGKLYVYSTFIFAGLSVISALLGSINYSGKLLLVILIVVTTLWFSEKIIKDRKVEEIK